MDKLQQARQEISRIDREMAELFRQRMQAAQLVAEHKKEHGLPILDSRREQELIQQNSALIQDPQLREFYVLFLRGTMAVSRRYQQTLLSGMQVAYSGTEGAFAHLAARRIFPGVTYVPFHDFRSAYEAVERGQCDCAVLPLENSYAGEVGQVMDLCFFGSLHVNGVYSLPVRQSLLGLPGTQLSQVTTAVSHPQALEQCAGYLHRRGLQSMDFTNTAAAAAYVAQQKRPELAAIANAGAAEIYGLEVLEENINQDLRNTTRFGVFSRVENTSLGKHMGDHFILLFTIRNEVGSLARTIDIIGRYGFNMRTLRSRPVKELLWEYYFYLEIEGDIHTSAGQEMLRQLQPCCDRIKIAGSFSRNSSLEEA
mgnify:CR=1 FL=1